VEHLYVKFGDCSCIVILRYRAEKQTDRQTHTQREVTLLPQLPLAWVNTTEEGTRLHWSTADIARNLSSAT